ncbi:helix-turn-helix transcriptional regulator [Streptosporangium sp. NPDC049304]|uniref:helix-turn-helix domain-containing protein n=1 Tax=Streptosporangium sp. NPDC049304 TaxID=3154830 RepID=UPI00342A1B69
MSVGPLIQELRLGLHLSQTDLAHHLAAVSGRKTITRETVSKWENEKVTPGPFWRRHLATVLQVPQSSLEAELVKRRTFLVDAVTLGIAPLAPVQDKADISEIFASVSGGDAELLGAVQTTYRTDLHLSGLAIRDRPTIYRLVKWMHDGATPVLRVNAAGIIAKSRDLELSDMATAAMLRDVEVRRLYLSAVASRVGTRTEALIGELFNPRDAGARWCAAVMLQRKSDEAARAALLRALRTEPVRETIRTIGLAIQGEDPCT